MLETKVSIAKVGTKSLRSTVPQGIVSYLDLEVGDKLEWTMIDKNNERTVRVTKQNKKNLKNLKKPLEDAFSFEHLSV
jgi:hypothetical protein